MQTCEIVQCQRFFKGKCSVNLNYAIKDCPAGVNIIDKLKAKAKILEDLCFHLDKHSSKPQLFDIPNEVEIAFRVKGACDLFMKRFKELNNG